MKEEFFINRQGKRFVLFAGLLDEAHTRGLKSIITSMQQIPSEENGNTAIVYASVAMQGGETFTGIGDASPENVARNIAPHLIRMAETRAKARALRDAINVGVTALEELGEDAQEQPQQSRSAGRSSAPTPIRGRPPQDERSEPDESSGDSSQEEERSINRVEVARIRDLCGKLKQPEETLEEAVGKLEDFIGAELELWTGREAGIYIGKLQAAYEERQGA